MKAVLMVQTFAFGGIQRLIVDEANELHRRGIEVHLVYFEKTSNDFLLTELRVPSENVHHVSYLRMRSLGSFMRVVRLLRSLRADVLMTHHWFANTVGRFAGFVTRVPHILAFEHSTYDAVKSPRQFFLDRLLQHISDRVVAVSPAVRDSLVRHGISPRRISVVADAVELSRFCPQTAVPEEAHFLFVGRLIKDKGVDVLFAACAQLKNAHLTILGNGPEKVTLEAQARELGIEKLVTFAGATRDLAPYFEKATALVLPSRREGFGLVLVEALASGVPVIASRIGGVTDIVKDGENGILVAPDDSNALAEALTAMMNPDHRTFLASRACASVEKFSIQTHVDALLKTASYHS